jgi:UDP-glucose 4-epimerase
MGKAVRNEVIEIWGDGQIVRDYIFIEDFIDAVYRAAVTRTRSRIFNIGSGAGISLNSLITAIREVTNYDVKYEYLPKRLYDVPVIFLDITRAKEELGWTPATPLEKGLKKTLLFVNQLADKSIVADE